MNTGAKQQTSITTNETIRFLFSLWKHAPKLTTLLLITQAAFAILTTTLAPLFVSRLLTSIAQGTATFTNSSSLLVGYVFILLLGDVVAVRASIFISFTAVTKMQRTVYEQMFTNLMEKSLTFHANRMSGGIVNNASKLNGSIERFWDTIAFNATPIVITVTSVCIALSFNYWQYALILFILSAICAGFIVNGQHHIAPFSQAASRRGSDVVAYFADTMSNISSVKAFASETFENHEFASTLDQWQAAMMKERRSVVIRTLSFGTILTTMNMAAFVAAVIATQFHIGSLATTYLVIVYTLSVVAQLWSVSSLTRTYIRIIGDAGPMIEILQTAATVQDSPLPVVFNAHKGEIIFDNIAFAHDERSDTLFTNFSLRIKAGQKVGLVGYSGSGKTSLTRLLLRFSDIEAGRIMIDDYDIATITQQDLRRSIAYVSQEPILFHRTLQENIAYAKPRASKRDVIKAAQKAHALEFIDKLPNGFDTLVGERGVKLSGGQRQRVAIARAILKDAPILVLDEATSALDSESEKMIQASLTDLMKNRTSIVIAHRLSTIAKLDRIVVLDNGRIVEDGTHAELLAAEGMYARLWAHQSGGFIEE